MSRRTTAASWEIRVSFSAGISFCWGEAVKNWNLLDTTSEVDILDSLGLDFRFP